MELTGEALRAMPLEARLLRFYEFSEEFNLRASLATDEKVRANFLSVAEAWRVLAIKMEAVLREKKLHRC